MTDINCDFTTCERNIKGICNMESIWITESGWCVDAPEEDEDG